MTNCSTVTYLGTHHHLFELMPKIEKLILFEIEIMQLVMKHCGFRLAWIRGIILDLNVGTIWYFNNLLTFFIQ